MEQINPPNNLKPRTKRLIYGGAVLAGAGVIFGGILIHKDEQKFQHEEDVRISQITAGMAEDGFDGTVAYASKFGARVDLKVSENCTLKGVSIEYDDTIDPVTDVKNYNFTAYAFPKTYEERNNASHRTETHIAGQETVFIFQDAADLEKNILGEQPCAALAGNLAIQGEVR